MSRILIPALLLVALPVLPAVAALPTPLEAEAPLAKVSLEEIPSVSLFLPDRTVLAREDAVRRADGLPYRFAVPQDVALTPGNSGAWSDAADGRRVWRLRVTTPGATSLNLGFLRYDVPGSARLAVYPASDRSRGLAWDARDVAGHGQLWTPAMGGDEIVVELSVAADEAGLVDLELGRIGSGYRGLGAGDKAGACNIDVICPEGDPWREDLKAVAAYSTGASIFCTGAMVNNTAEDGRPLFLTADHCGIWSGNEASVVVYWNFESPSCGLQGGGDLSQTQTGATVLAHWGGSDFSLIELDDQPPAAYDVRWAGWDRRDRNNETSVAIHHPRGDEKSISFDADSTTITNYVGETEPGDGSHHRIGAWEQGTTEDGSSGSPLFNESHRITGQLHGGYASCSALDASDWYGRLAVSWEGGSALESRLRDHLDPLGTGVGYLNMLGAGVELDPTAAAVFAGGVGGTFTPAAATYTLTNSGASQMDLSYERTDAAWFSLSAPVSIAPGSSGELVIGLIHSAAEALAAGTYTGQVRILDMPGGALAHVIDVRLTVSAPGFGLAAIAPNPARSLVTIHYTMAEAGTVTGRVYDMRGQQVSDLGSWSAVAGEQTLEWAPRTVQGGLMPSGGYVLELEAGGQKSRQRFTIIR